MAANTTYQVDIKYDLKGNANRGLKQMGSDAKQATSAMGGLRSMIGLVAGAGALAFGKKAFIDFNSQVQKMKISLATVTTMNLGVPFESAQKASERLVNTFQKMAAQSPATTKDFVEMANQISSGVLQAGLGLKGLERITKGAITASSALGAAPEVMALDTTQMLAGTVGIRDRYARQLLAGIGEKDYHKFNKYNASKRAQLTDKAFSQPALEQASTAFGESFEGQTSTLKDNLEIALGKVGLPLMKEMSEQVKSWNQWITGNPERIAQISESIGSGLKEAFGLVKDIVTTVFPILKEVAYVIRDVMAFVSNHRDVLMNTAKMMLAYKGITMGFGAAKGAAGFFGGAASGIKGMVDAVKGIGDNSNGVSNGFMSIVSAIPGVLGGLGKFAGALYTISGLVFGDTQKDKANKARANAEILAGSSYTDALAQADVLKDKMTKLGIFGQISKGEILVGEGLQMAEDYEKLKANLDKTKSNLIAQGIKSGLITDEVSGRGERKLTLHTIPDIQDNATLKAAKVIQPALEAMFKREIRNVLDSTRIFGGQLDYSKADYAGGSRGGLAFFTEKFLGKDDNLIDAYDAPNPKPPDVNVNINKIEVYSDDPDRFVAQAVQSFEEVSRNPTQAHEIMRGAF